MRSDCSKCRHSDGAGLKAVCAAYRLSYFVSSPCQNFKEKKVDCPLFDCFKTREDIEHGIKYLNEKLEEIRPKLRHTENCRRCDFSVFGVGVRCSKYDRAVNGEHVCDDFKMRYYED